MWALDVPNLLTPCKSGLPPTAKCRSELVSSRQWSYPVRQPSATAASYPQLVPYPKLQTPGRCGRQLWQPPSPSQADAGSHTTRPAARQWQRSPLADRLSAGSWCLPLPDKTSAYLSSSFYSASGYLAASIRGAEGCSAKPSITLMLCPISAGRREQAVLSPGKVRMSDFSSSVYRRVPPPLSLRKQFPRRERAAECSRGELQVATERQLGATS